MHSLATPLPIATSDYLDTTPVLQYRVLQMMEPLLATGEASAKYHGYLYDRVMLKFVGTQRYGTQLQCKDGRMQPQPLENPGKLDVYRREIGMLSMAEYLKLFPEHC